MTDTEKLKEYLGRYRTALKRKNSLQERLRSLSMEMDIPLHAVTYSGMPKTSDSSDGVASIVIRKCEIEDKVHKQMELVVDILLNIMTILDYLPADSIEREILEYRYLDGKKWSDVEAESGYTRSACFAYHDSALKQLISFEKVKLMVLENYKE